MTVEELLAVHCLKTDIPDASILECFAALSWAGWDYATARKELQYLLMGFHMNLLLEYGGGI